MRSGSSLGLPQPSRHSTSSLSQSIGNVNNILPSSIVDVSNTTNSSGPGPGLVKYVVPKLPQSLELSEVLGPAGFYPLNPIFEECTIKARTLLTGYHEKAHVDVFSITYSSVFYFIL